MYRELTQRLDVLLETQAGSDELVCFTFLDHGAWKDVYTADDHVLKLHPYTDGDDSIGTEFDLQHGKMEPYVENWIV